jgi:hypothetical protein
MILRTILLIAILGLFENCSQTDSQFQAIVNSPEKFHLTYVEITGILHLRAEDFAIYINKSAGPKAAIWINPPEHFLSEHKFILLEGKKVKLTGTFNKKDKGHLDQYAGTIHNAKIIEIEEK